MWRSPWTVRILKLLVSTVLIAAVIWQVGPNAVVPEHVRWGYLLAATGLFLLSNLLGAYQWNLLLTSAGIELSERTVTRAYFIALFFNNFMVGNIGGDVLRAFEVRRNAASNSHGRTAAGVATIIMDRFLGFFTMMWFAGVAAGFSEEHSKAAVPIVGLLGAFVVLGVLITSRRIGTRVDSLVARLLPDRMAQTVVNLRTGFVCMRQRYRVLIFAAFISGFVQGMRIVVHYLCGLAIGVNAPFIYFATFIPLISVAAAIPISFGGLGTREWAAVGLFGTVGVGGAGVVTMELFAHAITLVSSLPGALAFVLRDDSRRVPSEELSPTQVEGP